MEEPPITNEQAEKQLALEVNNEINFFGATNFRNQNRKFGIKTDDRRRHMYVVGKTGMGKTTLLENMVLNDVYSGHGVGVVDPHGDFAEKIINYIPPNRINDVVYFNPSDIDFPIGFNILETIRPEQKHLVASGLMGVFKKIWPDVWSARMEYILNNTILALIDFPGTTLLGINRMLADDAYRKRVVNNTQDPVVKAYWQTEFANYSDKFRSEAVSPIQNKIGQFLSASVIRNIVAQVKSRINIREIMDTQKIFIMNLSKGRIGEDNSRLLGGMLVTKIQLAAMERVDIEEKDRRDFFLYVDEFQNFANESFANILSEARKYRLDLIMAHQYMEQLDEKVLAAVIGNVGTTVTFRVGSNDAEILAKEFAPTFVEEDLINLPKFQTYLKLMIDGVASRPFSATTLPPIGSPTASTDKVVRVSRERYATSRDKIEDKIMRWSGMVPMTANEAAELEMDEDEAVFAGGSAPVAQSAVKSQPGKVSGNAPAAEKSVAVAVVAKPIEREKIAEQKIAIENKIVVSGLGGGGGEGGKKKKRKRKKKNRGEGSMAPGHNATVLLGDPTQKGISLSQALGADFPKQKMDNMTPASPVSAPSSNSPASPSNKDSQLGFIPADNFYDSLADTPAPAVLPETPATPPIPAVIAPLSVPPTTDTPRDSAPVVPALEAAPSQMTNKASQLRPTPTKPSTAPKTVQPGRVVKVGE